jgi:predicted acylesterase/phospholipase RssA
VPDNEVLKEAAENIGERVRTDLQDGNVPSRVSIEVADGQFRGIVEVVTVDEIKDAEQALSTLESIKRKRPAGERGGDPRLELDVIIPPETKPDRWSSINEAPRTFQLTIQATLKESEVEKPTILPIGHSGGDCALVMKGGGIKGLAYVGALEVLLEHYTFDRYVGTSAGAITALLLAAGYTTDELKGILETKDFRDFFDAPWWKKPWNLFIHRGLNHATAFTRWIDRLLAKKLNSPTQVTLKDIGDHGSRVTVFASRKGKSQLKFDSKTDTEGTAASYAARCSMSIPLAFVPQTHQGFLTFDGGLQQNYPVGALLEENPNADFLGMYLGPEIFELKDTSWQLAELLSIWTESHDAEFLRKYPDRTVIIDPTPIGTLDFELSADEKKYLLICGRVGALRFLEMDSERHKAAVKDRDALRSVVEKNRKWRSWRNRLKRLLCVGMLAVTAWLVYRYVPQLYDWYFAETETQTDADPAAPPFSDSVGGPGKFPDLSLISELPDEKTVVNHVPRQKRELVTLECVNYTGVDLSLFVLDCSAHFRNPQENNWIARPCLASGESYVQLLSNESTGYYAVVVREPIYSLPTGKDAYIGAWDLLESKEVRLNLTRMNGHFQGEVVFDPQ